LNGGVRQSESGGNGITIVSVDNHEIIVDKGFGVYAKLIQQFINRDHGEEDEDHDPRRIHVPKTKEDIELMILFYQG